MLSHGVDGYCAGSAAEKCGSPTGVSTPMENVVFQKLPKTVAPPFSSAAVPTAYWAN